MGQDADRKKVIDAIQNPLKFFALALLVIESILAGFAALGDLSPTYRFALILVMSVIFLTVVVLVGVITIRCPRHLYEKIADEMAAGKGTRNFIEDRAFTDFLDDRLRTRVNPDCLRGQQETDHKGVVA